MITYRRAWADHEFLCHSPACSCLACPIDDRDPHTPCPASRPRRSLSAGSRPRRCPESADDPEQPVLHRQPRSRTSGPRPSARLPAGVLAAGQGSFTRMRRVRTPSPASRGVERSTSGYLAGTCGNDRIHHAMSSGSSHRCHVLTRPHPENQVSPWPTAQRRRTQANASSTSARRDDGPTA